MIKQAISIALCAFLLSCGGGGGSPPSSLASLPVIAKPAPILIYGSDFPKECQSSTISTNSTQPADFADASSADWTGNEYWPMTKGRYVAYCRHNIAGVVSAKSAANGNFFINITSAKFRDEGSISFDTMPCRTYGGDVHTMTYVAGLSAPRLGFVHIQTGLYDTNLTYVDGNENSVTGLAEIGNADSVEFGGILLAPQNPVVGQVIRGSWTGHTSCDNSAPSKFSGAYSWMLSTVSTQDPFGMAVNPVETTCLFESSFGGATCYVLSKDVGAVEIWTIQISDGNGHFFTNADGDYIGSGVIYTAVRQDRQGISLPSGGDIPWTEDN